MTDWLQIAKDHQDDYLRDLTTLLKIKSVRDDTKASADAPLGPGPTAALHAFLKMAQKDGFKTKNIDNVAGYAEVGDGDETVAILAHVDVMPAGNGWDTDPFDPVIKDGKLFARGASDDKGPGMACYYALKILKERGVSFNKKIRFIVGTDEESNWTGMHHYFATEPAPTMGFSPDAEFPLINGEKGQVSMLLDMDANNDGNDQLKSFDSGLRFNMVPREADAVIAVSDEQTVAQQFDDFVQENPVDGSLNKEADGLHVKVIGKAAHGMEPEKGINAGTYLATFLTQLNLGGNAKSFVDFIAHYLHDDTRAHHLGIAYTDSIMGEMTMNVGLMSFKQGETGHIDMNFRYPKGVEPAKLLAKIEPLANLYHFQAHYDGFEKPHYVDPSDPIVTTLLNAYKDVTGDTAAQPEVVGGGTYGRLMKRGVAFGALMPNTPNTMHQANEYQPVDDLISSMAIYMKAIYDLAGE
ncbi:dipeptidase PepV [Limosilactobacillus secaliphilus]|uniref:Dipeptidase PepV n=1 Tax=Limosilactobacillus secaliphilus TaxID=396268 RepID=A0A0R2I9V5_9LACO|nr:dipeptidase PepV [Limosilactobacillus secaliphilus]KRN59196.1 dipeptidase PepV [Limosilactobacillus secaliphilus]